MEMIAGPLGLVGSVGSIGMGILGAAQQSAAQRQAGQVAYQNALLRNQQLQQQAEERLRQANEAQASSQRQAIEAGRVAGIRASRAQAVMAASGAGVDQSLIAGILGEGDYAKDVALYEGDTRATGLRYQANLDRYEGDMGVYQGLRTRAARNRQADTTLAYGILGGLLQGASLASRYAKSEPPVDPGKEPARTRRDADLGGYGGSPRLEEELNRYR